MRQAGAALAALVLMACSALPAARAVPPAPAEAPPAEANLPNERRAVFPPAVQQGAMVIGKVPAGSVVRVGARTLRVTPYGSVVFGVGRDEQGPIDIEVEVPGEMRYAIRLAVTPRDWPIQRINGVPPKTVNPPPEIAERIRREQALVAAARVRDDERADFAQAFVWPVRGRISGRFGNQRVYNGQPGAAHSGMDIAAANGTPVLAPAAGVVTFAAPDLYLTGGTLLLDHGHGISSNFLHLSRIDVKVGDRVTLGQVIGAVGATGRSTGPHLHWGMNWFDVRIDPLLVLERGDAVRAGK
ncbi:M23 family metallopeptidase [Lysobacter silvisoli]|uniref:M23 family peptidase n=1 Tax=Lysobacter silvisoli TaxID=2293254 RepID=A0A371K2C9_9GAMM|nr:M23 family metallopeptidase [Lysobacter silvisoli]RDZ28022.1 M23 family peptidase [Lysobacter silvisoli]